MKGKTILKIILWFLAVVVLVLGITFAIGYFYYAKIVRTYLTEMVQKESKGLYKAEIGDLYLNLLGGNLTIDRFSLLPDTALYRARAGTDTVSPLLIKLTINQFRIRGFHVMAALKERKIDVTRIRFIGPEVTVFRMKMPPKTDEGKNKETLMSIPLPKGLSSILVKEFMIEDAKLEFVDCTKDTITRNTFPTCNIFIRHILVDSAHTGKKRLFNADDISITLGSYALPMKNGMNEISFGEIGLSTATGEVYAKNFHLKPLFSKYDYSRKLGFQTDWMDIRINKVIFKRMDLRKLLFEGKMKAGLLEIDTLTLDDYRDKRVDLKPGFKPPMPQQAIRNLKSYLRIDTILLKNGKASYAEQVGEVPGTIFFDKLNATFTGLTNDSLLLHAGLVSELKGSGYLMGQGRLDVTVRFNFADKQNSFSFSAMLGPFDLTIINPMLSNLVPAKVLGGKVKRVFIPMVYANDDVARGKMLFYYNDLKVSMVDQEQTTWSKVKKGVINFAANDLLLSNDNPNKAGKMHTAVIFAERKKELGFVNYFWRSAFSGIKSTIGFNSKDQKSMIKEEKKIKKEEAKEERKIKKEQAKEEKKKNRKQK
ncbi:MAG: hypothetical protein ACOYNC_10295 [Bacteroidales bacterium]